MSLYGLIIKNGTVVNSEKMVQADIAVKNGKIEVIGHLSAFFDQADALIDASHLHILPGLIDTHVHLNEPGRTDREGFEKGSQSLAAEGVTTFFDIPLNSTP